MNMLRTIRLLVLLIPVFILSCQNSQNPSNIEVPGQSDQKAVVKEVIQTSSYTYLLVEKNDQEQWIAINKQEMKEGAVIYFEEGLKMENFTSPELQRTFASVYFVQEISDQPITHDMPKGMTGTEPQKPVLNKMDIRVEQPEGGVTIGELYAKRDSYSGKNVKVRGKVTKVNLAILERNWVHIQDGTADGENFDLTVTTDNVPQVGDVVTYTGTLTLNKDFGSGYSYELLLENGMPVENL